LLCPVLVNPEYFLILTLSVTKFTRHFPDSDELGERPLWVTSSHPKRSFEKQSALPMQYGFVDQLQPERPHQEHRHLVAGDRVFRAIVAIATANGDALIRELLDPVNCPVAEVHVVEVTGSRRW